MKGILSRNIKLGILICVAIGKPGVVKGEDGICCGGIDSSRRGIEATNGDVGDSRRDIDSKRLERSLPGYTLAIPAIRRKLSALNIPF